MGAGLRLGANFVRKVEGVTSHGYCPDFFKGITQKLHGRVATQGQIYRTKASNWVEYDYTKLTETLPNGGRRVVSRKVPHGPGPTGQFDTTKITEVSNATVGERNVQTVQKSIYKYTQNDLNISRTQVDSSNRGIRELIFADNGKVRTKNFYTPDRKFIKRVYYDPQTGLRTSARLENGQVLKFDAKGMPQFTAAEDTAMNLGGLDKLLG